MSAKSYGRLLREQGRRTTPGLISFEPYADPVVTPQKEPSSQQVAAVELRKQPSQQVVTVEANPPKIAKQVAVNKIEEAAKISMSVPLSKTKETDKLSPVENYSFYKRKFRVRGKQAWECAMRDLGTVDTLFNRYGYVQPQKRPTEK